MALEAIGKIITILPETGGQSQAGKAWTKQEFIIETNDQYPKKICISLMGDKINELRKYAVGTEVKVSLNIESREYNGKWYTNVSAWRIEANGSIPPTGGNDNYAQQPQATQQSYATNPLPAAAQGEDDLPF
jgi:hypothetical protein